MPLNLWNPASRLTIAELDPQHSPRHCSLRLFFSRSDVAAKTPASCQDLSTPTSAAALRQKFLQPRSESLNMSVPMQKHRRYFEAGVACFLFVHLVLAPRSDDLVNHLVFCILSWQFRLGGVATLPSGVRGSTETNGAL